MEAIKVTIKEDVSINGSQFYAGAWAEFTPGSNIEQERFDELVESGAIEIGLNEEFMNQKAVENAEINKEKI